MIIRQFLASTRNASAGGRAEAASVLARTYLYGNLDADAAWEAKTALLALLDDPSPVVRRALSEACAASARTPRPLVVALSCDVPEVAGPVLARSPVLTDADLVDAAALGDEGVRALIARRHHLSHAVSGALAEIAECEALVALVDNPTALITAGRLLRMVERLGHESALREALLARPDLPPEVRHALALALAQALSEFVTGCGWLSPARCERIGREAGERAALDLCQGSGAAAIGRLVRHLRATHQLNAGLILRAILSGRADFAQAALADLSGLDHAGIARAMRDPLAVADLHHRAGLPRALLPAMQAALAAWRETSAGAPGLSGAGLSRRMIERAITGCAQAPTPEMRAVTALLTRYEAEAARDEAREAARAIAAEAAGREVARRETLAADAAWQAALKAQRQPEAGPAATAMPEMAVAAADTQAPAPFNPVGAILDGLPDRILERFRDDREPAHGEAAQVQEHAQQRARQAAGSVLDGLEAGLLAEFRAGRSPAPNRPDDLQIAA